MSTARRKKQAEEADDLIREMAQRAKGEGEEQPAADPPQEQPAEDDQEAAAQQAVHDQGAVQEQQELLPDEDEPAARSEENDPAYWKQRYKSLDGILRQRDAKIDQLSDIIANMQQSVAQMQAQQSAPAEPAVETQTVSKEDETAFGADLIDLIRRVFAQESVQLEQNLRQQFSGLESKMTQVESSVKETAQDKFERYLDEHSSGWRDTDKEPEFMEWIKASRVRYQQFTAGVNQLDYVAVSEIFNMYKSLKDAADAQEEARREAPKQQRQQQLEKQLAPGKSKLTGQDHRQADEPKQWTSSEITRTYAKRKTFTPQKWAELEREIANAQKEGRVDFSR